jgi:hypothetical protein
MPGLISLYTAKDHIGETSNVRDDDLEMKLLQAESIVLAYIARPSDADWTAMIAGWTEATLPKPVQAAILLMFGELYRDRGDEDPNLRQRSIQELNNLPADIAAILWVSGYRAPSLA